STHALREEGDGGRDTPWVYQDISTHALREEGDQSTEPSFLAQSIISTHALREEGDPTCCLISARSCNFYPRPPRGGRLDRCPLGRERPPFLPTPSARRA